MGSIYSLLSFVWTLSRLLDKLWQFIKRRDYLYWDPILQIDDIEVEYNNTYQNIFNTSLNHIIIGIVKHINAYQKIVYDKNYIFMGASISNVDYLCINQKTIDI